MNLFFFSRRLGLARHFNLSHPLTLGAAGVLALGVLALAFTLGMQLGQRSTEVGRGLAAPATAEAAEVARLRQQVQDRVDAISVRVGQLNAHLIRLDALGKRLTEMANISSREFNFDSAPAVGGPEETESSGVGAIIPDLTALLNTVQQRIETRDAQLLALESVILSRRLNETIRPDGRPVLEGYVSSYFGERQDPFTGHEAWHKGVDFAGEAGAEIVAVAAGIVTRSETSHGYGNLVEINHGNGYVTRYGHSQRLLVKSGDIVTRGQPVATIGSTGRSTGPHVHFEVLRNGQHVNPLSFTGR